jgi:dihydroorotate dehydrogenase
MGIYRTAIWPFLRKIDSERAHRLTLRTLGMAAGPLSLARRSDSSLPIDTLGLHFSNPIGIAAGFDKDGEAPSGLLALGFGFIELGTVTPRAQSGNPQPRLFRLEADRAVINRMGFNNQGADVLAARLGHRRPNGIIGINIGANKDSADRIADYVSAFRSVSPYADYITVNISSPNTPGLRALQDRGEMRALVVGLQDARAAGARALPLLAKIAPDLDAGALADIAEVAMETKLDGLIVSNTTIGGRAGLHGPHADQSGGLSGAPLFRRSTEVLAEVYRLTGDAMPLIGVGGIASAGDAYEKILAGASLVQLYTALVYEGPGLVRRIQSGLSALVKADGFTALRDAVGAKAKLPRIASQVELRSA